MELWGKKSQPIDIAKVRKLVLKRTLSVSEPSFDKEIMSMAHEIISHLSRDQRYHRIKSASTVN